MRVTCSFCFLVCNLATNVLSTCSRTMQQAKPQARRRCKGFGWSKTDSKSPGRQERDSNRKPRFYAVARGFRPGIYVHWSNAAKQVNGYHSAVHQSFPTLEQAREFMRQRGLFPLGVKAPFPPASQTAFPPQHGLYGFGWSKKGSKSPGRQDREANRKPRFYAVARGFRPGIYVHWSNAAKQVNGYHSAVHQSFPTLEQAREFMRQRGLFPSGVKAPFLPAPQTPQQCYVYESWSDYESSTFRG